MLHRSQICGRVVMLFLKLWTRRHHTKFLGKQTQYVHRSTAHLSRGYSHYISSRHKYQDNVLFCFIDARVRKIRNEASRCSGIFSRTLRFYYVASSPGSPLPHLLDGHRNLAGRSAFRQGNAMERTQTRPFEERV